MSNTLRLAAPAIRELIERDPAFEFELQRCVIAEIVRGMMPRNLDQVYRNAIASEVEKARSAILGAGMEGKTYDEIVRKQIVEAIATVRGAYHTNTLPTGRQKEIYDAVTSAVDAALRREIERKIKTIDDDIEVKLATRIAKLDLDRRIEEIVDARVEAEIERRVAERFARIAAAAKELADA